MIRGKIVEVGRRELLDGGEADVVVIAVADLDALRQLGGMLYREVEISTEIDLRTTEAPSADTCDGALDSAVTAAQDTRYARRS